MLFIILELFYDRGNHQPFTTALPIDLEPAGTLAQSKEWDFEFVKPDKLHESYQGTNVRLRYFVRFSVLKSSFSSNIVSEQEVWVMNYQKSPEVNKPIKMEVGIEDCLHIEFEYNRSKYHLKDVIIGKIYFLLVRVPIRYMEVALIKRESTGSGPNLYNENEPITKYEIMDGAPVRGESIPIRLFLAPFDLTPTYKNVQNKFSVKYYINLVLVDEEDRRYFKQQEIALWRKKPDKAGKKKVRTTGGKKSYQQYDRDQANPALSPEEAARADRAASKAAKAATAEAGSSAAAADSAAEAIVAAETVAAGDGDGDAE